MALTACTVDYAHQQVQAGKLHTHNFLINYTNQLNLSNNSSLYIVNNMQYDLGKRLPNSNRLFMWKGRLW